MMAWLALVSLLSLFCLSISQELGSWKKVDVDMDLKNLLQMALSYDSHYNEAIQQRFCVNDILSIDEQVVAGINYRFTVNACVVNETKSSGVCTTDDGSCLSSLYIIEVFDQEWTSTLEISGVEAVIDDSEEKLIDGWIDQKHLNEYGDPMGTQYLGGNPLFDQSSGKQENRYQYIVRHHPERPWQPSNDVNAVLSVKEIESNTNTGFITGSIIGLVVAVCVVLVIVTVKKRRSAPNRVTYTSVRLKE